MSAFDVKPVLVYGEGSCFCIQNVGLALKKARKGSKYMNQQKNQESPRPGFLEGIGSEVSAESAPLLQFITQYAWLIAGAVILLLLILGGMGIWNWHQGNRLKEARDELARINTVMDGTAREGALRDLAESAPAGMKFYVYMTLGQCARENGHPDVAAEAYERAAGLEQGSALGLAAALGRAGSLLEKGDSARALELLQGLDNASGDTTFSMRLKEMLAEAAEAAGDMPLAIRTYQELGAQVRTAEGAYYRSRADELENAAKKSGLSQGGAKQ